MRKIRRTIKYVVSIGIILTLCSFGINKAKALNTKIEGKDLYAKAEQAVAPVYENAEEAAKELHEMIQTTRAPKEPAEGFDSSLIPQYEGKAYVTINDNEPFFTDEEKEFAKEHSLNADAYELYGELDLLGRCQAAIANVGPETMPTEPRGEIGMVKPTGWKQEKYPGIVNADNPDEPAYLYNRCHLIGFQLTGENANEQNLITGTRYFNVKGMLDCENEVAYYVKNTGNHVLYRVTPIFDGMNMLCNGVLMEAYSVEDDGAGVNFCTYAYNVQPGVEIDYATGESHLKGNSQ